MKKTFITIIAAAASVMAATSCGGGTSKEVAVRDVELYGDICYENSDTEESETYDADDYISVPDGSYKFYVKDDKLYVSVYAQVIKDFPDSWASSVSAEDFELQIYDTQGDPIKNADGESIYMKLVNIENLEKMLNWSSVGDSYNWTFCYALLGETGIIDQIADFDIAFDIYAYYRVSDDSGNTSTTSIEEDLKDVFDETIDEDLEQDLQDAKEALEDAQELMDILL
ncbi:MAG TPA: hypothetical protein IAC03_04540 [Candidatus Coprenecus pullistercoris]|nr:hypothetical protein [Candidatus Coprenecus pullistercoris]